MRVVAARIVARILMGSLFMGGVLASVAQAATIRGLGTFEVHLYGDEEFGEVFDPPLVGSGSFEIRSRPYDPGDVFEVYDFEVLNFSFSIAGFTWDESNVQNECYCGFSPDGQPLWIDFDLDNGVASGFLGFGFEADVFSIHLLAPNLVAAGNSDSQTAGLDGPSDFSFVVVPEAGSFALLSLGLLGLALTRRSLRSAC